MVGPPDDSKLVLSTSKSSNSGLLELVFIPIGVLAMLLSVLAKRWKVVLSIVVLLAGAASVGGLGGVANADGADLPNWEISIPNSSVLSQGGEADTKQPQTEAAGPGGVNETRVEALVHKEVNEYRGEHGLSRLHYDSDLAEIAGYHSSNMAKNHEMYHQSPSGQNFEDRYEKFGYNCRVRTEGGYYGGAENVAKTWFDEFLTNGDRYSNEQELAEGIARMWYNSEGHRKNMLTPEWQNEAIGVELVWEDGKLAVYATQNFC